MLHRDLVKPLRKADPTRGYVSRLGDALRSELCFQIPWIVLRNNKFTVTTINKSCAYAKTKISYQSFL